jgi:hypothetical protein
MSHAIQSSRPFGDLFSRISDIQDSRLPLQETVQLAVQIEFSTIPAYLTALYSIKQPDSQAYQLLRSVVVEEMFHVNQAANLLVAIGGLPKVTGEAVPTYPNYLPHANPDTTPYVGLYRASPDVFENVFAAIETPAPPHAPPRGERYDTIAQVYDALLGALASYSGSEPLFGPHPDGRQRVDIYLGKFGGKPIEVTDMATARLGVRQIQQQGEGSVPEAQSYEPLEPWATYNQYGQRTDGTYGPIIGTPYEMSHFKKFRTVALDTAGFPETYPILSNPQIDDFHDPRVIETAEVFDAAYSIMLEALEASFRQPKAPGEPDPFFALALPLMHQVMPALARSLMTSATRHGGDSAVGPNAAPTFRYRPGCTLKDIPEGISRVIDQAKQGTSGGDSVGADLALLAQAHRTARAVAQACPNFK